MLRTTKLSVLVLLGLLLLSFPLIAQNLTLTTAKTNTVADGIVSPNEYSVRKDYPQFSVFLNRSGDTLSLAVVGETKGWVGLGLGSLKMDGATIFIGFIDADGNTQFKPQVGSGHRHSDPTTQDIASSIISYKMSQVAGHTTLELQLKASAYIKPDQKVLDVIAAVGPEASFVPHHIARQALEVTLGS